MKKFIYTFLLLIALATGAVAQSLQEGQPRFNFGLYGGYNFNIHSADFTKFPECPNCSPGFKSGTGGGFSFGGLFEYPLNNQMLIGLRAGYANLSGTLQEENIIGNNLLIDQTTGLPVGVNDARSEYVIDSKLSLLGIEPMFIYKPLKALNLSAGLRFGFMLDQTFSQHESILSPGDIVYLKEGSRTRNVMNDADIPEANAMLIHLSLGAGYEFPLGKKVTLMPEIRYYLGLNDVSNVTWKVSTLQASLALKYYVFPKKEKPVIKKDFYQRDTTIVYISGLKGSSVTLTESSSKVRYEETDEVIYEIYDYIEKYELQKPKITNLELALLLVGINPDGSRVNEPKILIEEIESAELFPLLPYIFYKEGSADINQSNLNLLTKSEVTAFNEDSLEWDLMTVYENVLNIVAARMKANPKAKMTITGTNKNIEAEVGKVALSQQRADAVKNYLTSVWDIAPDRISTKAQNLPQYPANNDRVEGKAENQRAEISTNDYEITKPIQLSSIKKSISPPMIEITPQVKSDVPIKDWTFSIRQEGEDIRTITGKGDITPQLWEVKEKPIPMTETNLEVKLIAKDENGTVQVVSKDIEIEQLTIREKRYELKDDKRIEKFSLILFDYDKADLKPDHRKVLDEIKSRIEPNSIVEIAGYADRTGTAEYNKDLATKRTAVIQKYLGVAADKLVVKNIGSDQLLYDNDTPHGRSYCRTVVITIATPVTK